MTNHRFVNNIIFRKIRHNKTLLMAAFLLLLVLANIPGCTSLTGTAILTSLQGDVQILESGKKLWDKCQTDMTLHKQDVVKSGADSSAELTFFEGSIISLNANTQIEVIQLLKSQTKTDPPVIYLKQQIGQTVTTLEKLTDPISRYDIETPVAVASVRGSIMVVSVAQDGTTRVDNREGTVNVTAQGVQVQVPVGGSVTVNPGEPPRILLSYDDGQPDAWYGTGGRDQLGYAVSFTPTATSFAITSVSMMGELRGNPNMDSQVIIRITYTDNLTPLWQTSIPFSRFIRQDTAPSVDDYWVKMEVPNISVNRDFYVCVYAPVEGQGIGIYMGIDRSRTNEHSELMSNWQIVPWTLQQPKEQINWMIRAEGSAK
jgi:hypothetical protein